MRSPDARAPIHAAARGQLRRARSIRVHDEEFEVEAGGRPRRDRVKASPNGPPRGADLLAIERRSPYPLDAISSR